MLMRALVKCLWNTLDEMHCSRQIDELDSDLHQWAGGDVGRERHAVRRNHTVTAEDIKKSGGMVLNAGEVEGCVSRKAERRS
jgi:hypothetical protein